LIAFLIGLFVDVQVGTTLDDWLHDSAVVYQYRTEWKYSGIVVLDEGVPYSVGRKQALPLFAKATERLIKMGAKGVFLDAQVSKEIEGRMPYAQCIDPDGTVQWSLPECSVGTSQQCAVNSSELGLAPLKMNNEALRLFRVAPYLNKSRGLPDFLLFGFDAMDVIPTDGLDVSDRLVTFDDPVARWVDLSEDHAIHALIEWSQADNIRNLYHAKSSDELCDDLYPCRRVRLSQPRYHISMGGKTPVLPVSLLASCDEKIGLKAASLLRDKVVILQLAAPNESTDLVVTAMTTALFGAKKMTPGAQYLLDEVETLINQDSPVPPPLFLKLILFALIAIGSVVAGLYFQQAILWLLAVGIFAGISALCFVNPIMQLWPVAATMLIYFIGAGLTTAVLLIVGAKEGQLLRRYIPEQVRDLLMPLKIKESFENQRCHVVVLMSDLAGYTTVTGLLKEPDLILELMNDYLNETSFVLQEKYGGILEAYVGDMVCYYWLADDRQQRIDVYQKTLLSAIELRALQKEFFSSLAQRYNNRIDQNILQQIRSIIDAGTGLSAGDVVMGDLGPKEGVKKFGILGDPLNLAARIEGLTRLFSTDIIVSGQFMEAIRLAGLAGRRLGTVRVKGRLLPETLYALGKKDSHYFETTHIKQWETWLDSVEQQSGDQVECPDCYQKDKATINDWLDRGLLSDEGVWLLDKK
jgi:adenylate cyclase